MADKDIVIGEALTNLSRWVDNEALDCFEESYVFGSIIQRGADQFQIPSSDLDLLHVFRGEPGSLERWSALVHLLPYASELETALLRTFSRDNAAKPIVSHSVLTSFEASLAIHKDKQPQLLTVARFAPLPFDFNNQAHRVPVSRGIDAEFLHANAEPTDVFGYVQAIRNEFLAAAPNGRRKMQPVPVGDDPIPKSMERKAATLAWFNGESGLEDREDLTIGLEYMWDLMGEYKKEPVKSLRRKVGSRRRTRDTEQPLSPEDILLLAELLFDKAKASVKQSLTQKLTLTAERMIDRNQRSSGQESS